MCTAQGRREQANWLLEGRIEAGDAIKHRVSQKLCWGRPRRNIQRHNGHNSKIPTLIVIVVVRIYYIKHLLI